MELSIDAAGWPARATIEEEGGCGLQLTITAPDLDGEEQTVRHVLQKRGHQDYLDLFAALARRFGTRQPGSRTVPPLRHAKVPGLRALLTCNISPDVLYGYGDPAVLLERGTYHIVVTSNDAAQSFPILCSRDLDHWKLSGFVFPVGAKPAWTANNGPHVEYWAPELHRVGDGYLLCFAAREPNGTLGIGLATAEAPAGPFRPDHRPLLSGGVVDPHLHCGKDGELILFWKQDNNDVWPGQLSEAVHVHPTIAEHLFTHPADVRSAWLAGLLWPWIRTLKPMERFQAQQVLIEAAAADFPEFRAAVNRLAFLGTYPSASLEAMSTALRTTIRAQALDGKTRRLTGTATVVLANDLPWEGHVVEGIWLWHGDDAYYLFYSANDFATADYGIGVARGTSPLGPFVKQPEPLIRAADGWVGLGHTSVARALDGQPQLFFHGYRPDAIGYKAFRALLTAPLRFELGRASVGQSA